MQVVGLSPVPTLSPSLFGVGCSGYRQVEFSPNLLSLGGIYSSSLIKPVRFRQRPSRTRRHRLLDHIPRFSIGGMVKLAVGAVALQLHGDSSCFTVLGGQASAACHRP